MAKETAPPTEYVVLVSTQGSASNESGARTLWREVSRVSARTRREAIKTGSVRGGTQVEGEFKAVPVRSWDDGLRIKTEQTTLTHFEEVGDANGSAPAEAPAA